MPSMLGIYVWRIVHNLSLIRDVAPWSVLHIIWLIRDLGIFCIPGIDVGCTLIGWDLLWNVRYMQTFGQLGTWETLALYSVAGRSLLSVSLHWNTASRSGQEYRATRFLSVFASFTAYNFDSSVTVAKFGVANEDLQARIFHHFPRDFQIDLYNDKWDVSYRSSPPCSWRWLQHYQPLTKKQRINYHDR